MKIGRPQGVMVLLMGLVLLTVGILVLATVPAWGDWIGNYPAQAAAGEIPAQVAPVAQAMLNFVLGPLIVQIGGYIQVAGYFIGSLITFIAVVVSGAGTVIIRRAAK
jgi:hypothetical protein